MNSPHVLDCRPAVVARSHRMAANDPMPLAEWAKDTPEAKRWAAGKLRHWRNHAGRALAAEFTPEAA